MKTQSAPILSDLLPASVRADFPILQRKMNGKPLVFLDTAASSQKPQSVIDAISHYYSHTHANVHRGLYQLSQEATDAHEAARLRAARFFNAASEKEIIFTKGTTDGINTVAFCLGEHSIQAGDEILITEMEHHANIVPWQMLPARKDAVLKVVPVLDDGQLDMDAFDELLTDKTKIVGVVHISNTLGTINPIEEIIEKAHAKEIPVLVDGAQSAAHQKIDLQAMKADFFVCSSHKMLGPTGVGILYGQEKWLNALPPYQGGGEMIETVRFEGTTFNQLPFKFEAGTPNIAGTVGTAAAMDYIANIGIEAIAAHENSLLDYAMKQLREIDGIQFIGTAPQKAGLISFLLDGTHPSDVGVLLDKMGVAVRTGHHCTQPLMQRYGISGTVRASIGPYNTAEDIDILTQSVQRAAKMLR
jgi:cysteine desulfurase/selenocysteine lyase